MIQTASLMFTLPLTSTSPRLKGWFSIALGMIGAMLGSWISREVGLPEPFVVDVGGHPFPVVWSIIGATAFVAVISLLAPRRRRPL